VAAFVFDFAVENAIIRLSDAYAFTKTPSALTLFAGSQYQFPIYESVLVGLCGISFTALRLSALESPDGVSFVERGIARFRPQLRTTVRWLAVIGYAFAVFLLCYHLPYQFFGLTGHSLARLPTYMLPGH